MISVDQKILFQMYYFTTGIIKEFINLSGCFLQEDSSEMKLDFTFDAELAKLTEEKSEKHDIREPPKPIPMPGHTARSADLSPTSPANDLTKKIASVKNVWESMPVMPTVFEKG